MYFVMAMTCMMHLMLLFALYLEGLLCSCLFLLQLLCLAHELAHQLLAVISLLHDVTRTASSDSSRMGM